MDYLTAYFSVQRWKHILFTGFMALLAACMVAGCGASKQQSDPGHAVFFPPPPNESKVQYLTCIEDSRDILGRNEGVTFLVVGEMEPERVRHILKPYGIAVSGTSIYVCDSPPAKVVEIDPENKKFDFLKGNFSIGKLKKPINLALDAEGNIYVADTVRKEVLIYDAAGNFMRSLGKQYDMKPTDVAVFGDVIYVLDFAHSNIKIFDLQTGKLLETIGNDPEHAIDQRLSLPTNMAVDSRGFIYVTNMATGKIVKLDRDGHVVSSFGRLGDGFGEFGRPKGIDVDEDGRIYVVDAAHQNVQVFNQQGRLLMFFGDPGLRYGSLNIPAAIEVTEDGLHYFRKYVHPSFEAERLIFVTNQSGSCKISVYAMGHMKN